MGEGDDVINTRKHFWRGLVLVFLGGIILGAAPKATAQTNYPIEARLELRDANGNLITSTTPVCPEDGISVFSNGWQANSTVHATFHSDPVDLGNHAVDQHGELRFTFHVSTTNGVHTLRMDGTGANAQPRTVEAAILCECHRPVGGGGTAVLGSTVDAAGGGRGGAVAFGRTGIDATTLAWIGVDLFVVGLALTMARRKAAPRRVVR